MKWNNAVEIILKLYSTKVFFPFSFNILGTFSLIKAVYVNVFPRKGKMLSGFWDSYFIVCVDLMKNGDQTLHTCNEILH